MWLRVLLLSGALLGCEQIVGIQDPGRSSGPIGDPDTSQKDSSVPDGPSSNACAPVPTFGVPFNVGATDPLAVAVGDLDKDGVLDIAFANGSNVFIMHGTGGGNFVGPQPMRASPVVANDLLIVDVDNDGAQDLVTWDGIRPGHAGSSTISIHRQATTPGTFLTAQPFTVPSSAKILRILAVPKLDNNTVADLVVSSDAGAFPCFGSAASPGTFTAGTALSPGGTSDVFAATDIDGDGFDDIAMASFDTPGAQIFFNKTATPGTFEPVQTVGSSLVPNGAFGRFSANSPRKDVMLGNALFVQNSARVFTLQSSAATFGLISGVQNVLLVASDMNGDSKDDVVGAGHLAVQCASGMFYPASNTDDPIDVGSGSVEAQVVRDLNADGKPDVVQASGQFIRVILNQ